MMPGGAALFIFSWLALCIFTHSQFGVWGISQWSVFIQHQLFPLWFKAYLDTFKPLPIPDLLPSTQTRPMFWTLLILMWGLSNTSFLSFSPWPIRGDKKHSPEVIGNTVLYSLKSIMPVITLDVFGMSRCYGEDWWPVLHQRWILEGPHSF